MLDYQYPPQAISRENAKNWKWMQAFYDREISCPDDDGETVGQVAKRAANVRPTPEKLAYMDMELISFPHFGMSTVSGFQQGTGKEDPTSFNPVNYDADEWVRMHKEMGAKMIVFIAKHHDGYALWPTQQNGYCIRSSPWRDGKGDMVKEMSEACRKGGLKFGLYISLWDEHDPRSVIPRNSKKAADMTDEQRRTYQDYIETQLHETIDGRYGEITELWFDGAGTNGAEDWNRIYEIIYSYQPNCLVAMCGMGIRWCGNESAIGDEVNWNVLPMDSQLKNLGWVPFHYDQLISKKLPTVTDDLEQLKGKELVFIPQEGDKRLLEGGWHWDGKGVPFSLETLVNTYYVSIGMGATLITSPAPDPSGAFNDLQIERLAEWRHWIDESFKTNLLHGAEMSLTGWQDAPANGITRDERDCVCIGLAGDEEFIIEWSLPETAVFNNLVLEEALQLGQRVSRFQFEVWKDGAWSSLAGGRTIGRKRVLQFSEITADRVRLRITESRDVPALRFTGLYKALPYHENSASFDDADFQQSVPEPAELIHGLQWSYYEDANNGFLPYQEMFSNLDTTKVSPVATGHAVNPDEIVGQVADEQDRTEHFAMRFDGYFQASSRSVYTFSGGATTGCRLYIDNKLVVENDASNGVTKTGLVPLESGLHKVTILCYFGTSGKPGVVIGGSWLGNDGGRGWLKAKRFQSALRCESSVEDAND